MDETGKPIGIVVKESKEAHQLIEEFMLLANRTVAEHVSKIKVNKKPIPFPYRIHDKPDEEKLLPFVEFAKKYGHKFDTKTPERYCRIIQPDAAGCGRQARTACIAATGYTHNGKSNLHF